jgi:ribosomal protein S18 acetylase RimI-like enzyme
LDQLGRDTIDRGGHRRFDPPAELVFDGKGTPMIRPTIPEDTPALLALARGTGVFKPLELVALEEVLEDYHAREQAGGHRSVTYEVDGEILGFAYYAPAAMADRAWYLYWIAVTKSTQAQGIGSRLLRAAEAEIAQQGGRLFLIETSSLAHYEPTRRFYLKHGYEIACRLADFYADGDDLVVFSKRFLPRELP